MMDVTGERLVFSLRFKSLVFSDLLHTVPRALVLV